MNRDTVKEVISKEFSRNIDIDMPADMKSLLQDWLSAEVERLIESTASIKKDDLRMKSIVIMSGRRFLRLKELLLVLHNHALLHNSELLTDLLGLL